MSGIGHNRGPSLATGQSWRAHCWRQARSDLMPTPPLEVVRLRVARAREIGLDYRTYAGIRATTGHDLVAFLFSTNALRLLLAGDRLDKARRDRLAANLRIDHLIAVQPPLAPATATAMLTGAGLAVAAVARAPGLTDSWAATRDRLRALTVGRPGDRVLVIGDTGLEAEWAVTGRMAGFLASDRYFGAAAG